MTENPILQLNPETCNLCVFSTASIMTLIIPIVAAAAVLAVVAAIAFILYRKKSGENNKL